jgi:hypothetical protein
MGGLLTGIMQSGQAVKRALRGLLDDPRGTLDATADRNIQAYTNPIAQRLGLRAKSNPLTFAPQDQMAADFMGAGVMPMGMLAHTVYHGSPHKFTKFDMSKIGTGEGAQAYGHGLYMAEAKDVGKEYAEKLSQRSDKVLVNGKEFDNSDIQAVAKELGISTQAAYKAIGNISQKDKFPTFRAQAANSSLDWEKATVPQWDEAMSVADKIQPNQAGYIYKVDIPDEAIPRMLDWDSGGEQYYRDIVNEAGRGIRDRSGPYWDMIKDDPSRLMYQPGDVASMALRKQGIPGIKYFDGLSRGDKGGTRNYVLFDDNMPRILEINGQPTGLKPWADDLANAPKRPTNAQGQPIPPTQYELAHAEAQRVAALPVEQGGLGLPVNNMAMDRARAMGFEGEDVFHGAKNGNQSEFTPSAGGELGPGLYVTRDGNLASEFAHDAYGAPFPTGAGVYPVSTKRLNEIPRKEWVERRGEKFKELENENGGEWSSELYNQGHSRMQSDAEAGGFAGYYTPGIGGVNQGVVFDPKNIRSRFAAFNPANRDSADLLASYLMPAATTGLLGYGLLNNQDAYAR